MADQSNDSAAGGGQRGAATGSEAARASAGGRKARSMSMHDGIAVWCDCCSCEAEPYWAELADEMGIDLGSDYEDDAGR